MDEVSKNGMQPSTLQATTTTTLLQLQAWKHSCLDVKNFNVKSFKPMRKLFAMHLMKWLTTTVCMVAHDLNEEIAFHRKSFPFRGRLLVRKVA